MTTTTTKKTASTKDVKEPQKTPDVEESVVFGTLLNTYEETDSSSYSTAQRILVDKINANIASLSDVLYDDLGVDQRGDSDVRLEDLDDLLEHAGDLLTGYVLQRT